MNTILENRPSTFALIVDKLKDKSEEELKLLYIRFFSKELTDEWSAVTQEANFENVSDEDIAEAILKKRSGNKNV